MKLRMITILLPMLFAIGIVPSYCADTLSLKEYFLRLSSDPAPSPKVEELSAVEDKIMTMRSDEVADSLPAIAIALGHREKDVQLCAVSALIMIARRNDGQSLFKGQCVQDIMSLLNSPDGQLQSAPAAIFGYLGSGPPEESIPALISFANREDRSLRSQIATLAALSRSKPKDNRVITAMEKFLSRDSVDAENRAATLNVIRMYRIDSPRISNDVVQSLDSSDERVQLAGIGTLQQLGISALQRAEPRLRQMQSNTRESDEIRFAAHKALKSLERKN